LTEAVVHFLSGDAGGPAIPTIQIAEQVEKVVRELGQPAIAHAYAQAAGQKPARHTEPAIQSPEATFAFSPSAAPEDVVRGCLKTYGLQAGFTRDLASAHQSGLIVLGGLNAPRRLASSVADAIDAQGGLDLGDAVADALAATGGAVVLDGPEWHLAQEERGSSLPWLLNLPRLADRDVLVNVNCKRPPAWAHQNVGPLFADAPPAGNEPAAVLRTLVEEMKPGRTERIAWRWHLNGQDFSSVPHGQLLQEVAQRALAGTAISFVFDRPRRSPALADGIDRNSPALLMEVGLDLPTLLGQPAVGGDLRTFLGKLPSLARMAVSAGGQRRKYLRQHGDLHTLARGFLIDRAQLLVRAIGLDRLTQAQTGHAIVESPVAMELALSVLRTLQAALAEAGRAAHLAVVLDGTEAARTTVDTPALTPKQHLAAAGTLHAVTGWGTALLPMPADAAAIVELLAFAWKRTDVASLRLRRVGTGS
jgi:hypothetical protein